MTSVFFFMCLGVSLYIGIRNICKRGDAEDITLAGLLLLALTLCIVRRYYL